MDLNYIKIKSFEEIASLAAKSIANGDSKYNFIMAYEIDLSSIEKNVLDDVHEDAIKWAADDCPNELYINHGSYIKGGMEHITDTLKNKPSSNRALLSLISQEDISDSGDSPIPSFMLLQTSISNDILYCTSYFRAVEISVFLRINLEELRQKIMHIHKALLNFKSVKLVIFSFRAYHNSSISPLKKLEIDLMSAIEIFKLVTKTPSKMGALLREKSKESTVINLDSLNHLKESMNDIENVKNYNLELVKKNLDKAIALSSELRGLRTQHSHHESIDSKSGELASKLVEIAEEFEKCH